MSADIFAGKSKAEIAAIIEAGKAALKAGIQPSHPLVRDIVEIVNDIVKQEGVTADKVLAAVKAALGGKTGSTGAKKPSAINEARKALKAKGVAPFPVGGEGNAAAIAKYNEVFGAGSYDKLLEEYPPSPSAKYKK